MLVGLFILIWVWLDRKHRLYTLTTKRVVQRSGIIARETSEVYLTDIRNIVMKYDILERILGVGNLGLATAGHAGIEILIKGVPHPDLLRQMIVAAKDAEVVAA